MWRATFWPDGSSSRAARVRLRSIRDGRVPPISGGSVVSTLASLVSMSRDCCCWSWPAPSTSKNRAHSMVQKRGRMRKPPKCWSTRGSTDISSEHRKSSLVWVSLFSETEDVQPRLDT